MVERPEGWNETLYNKLSFEYLIECAKNYSIEEWNQAYDAYLRSEWERIFPDEVYDPENIQKLFDADFVLPDFSNEDFTNAIQEGADFRHALLKGADFYMAHLEGANFYDADLKGAKFWMAHLERSKFWDAHPEGADFRYAHLEGAEFWDTHLEGAQFILSVINGETLFTNNTIDTKTNFTGTSLSSARIDPELRTQLERNIRHIHWGKWYKKPKLYPYMAGIKDKIIFKSSPKKSLKKKKWEIKHCWVDTIINAFVRTFWLISNYGSSTKRIIAVFFGWNILWACIYFYILPFLPGINTTVLNVSNIWAALLQTNLMMFSITDLATEGLALFPMLCVTIHIVVGYFILAALITRLGIMFQNLSP